MAPIFLGHGEKKTGNHGEGTQKATGRAQKKGTNLCLCFQTNHPKKSFTFSVLLQICFFRFQEELYAKAHKDMAEKQKVNLHNMLLRCQAGTCLLSEF